LGESREHGSGIRDQKSTRGAFFLDTFFRGWS